MLPVFLDTSYFVALLNPRDHLHEQAVALANNLGQQVRLVTTELVLAELLNYFCRYAVDDPKQRGSLREAAVQWVRTLQDDDQVEVVHLDGELFEDSLARYEQHHDKTYSFVDCASMVVCDRHGVVEVATSDRHFLQAGFVRLLGPV